ncbi:MAG: TIGR00725 family protein [Thermoplasmatales archaeon]|nr:MAG: TIGR00725 family protein [Thermoplasmatales archaeon]
MKTLISVCGSDGDDSSLSSYALEIAEIVGRLIAQRNGILICGGRGGVMEAACKGAKEENGLTIGILPQSKGEANKFVDIAIPTGIGHKRNFLVASAGDAIIAIGGRWGTLNEISFAMIFEKPLVLIKNTGGCVDEIIGGNLMHDNDLLFHIVDSAEEAVEKAFELCKNF